ncbi:Protein CBG26058 [Caenorhabditis briggsae]|uniref:Protein CBG26058 n=1 Tax=Caenorhabditis briggsae TaxID=6238 RepID=B6ILP1_CAEBR|nr:Protein CBG26058 [Caenorhabditis briggsae]CAS00821.1 Protein CBG26058 [Caenorhabditis briggsae]
MLRVLDSSKFVENSPGSFRIALRDSDASGMLQEALKSTRSLQTVQTIQKGLHKLPDDDFQTFSESNDVITSPRVGNASKIVPIDSEELKSASESKAAPNTTDSVSSIRKITIATSVPGALLSFKNAKKVSDSILSNYTKFKALLSF